MGTIYTFQCTANTEGLSFSHRHRLKANILICHLQEQTLPCARPSLHTHTVKKAASMWPALHKIHYLMLKLFKLWPWSVYLGMKKSRLLCARSTSCTFCPVHYVLFFMTDNPDRLSALLFLDTCNYTGEAEHLISFVMMIVLLTLEQCLKTALEC